MSGLEYYIDVVFCIDCSASMEPVFRELKEKVMRFPRDLVLKMREKGKNPVQLRTRIISFTDEALTPESTFINFGAEIFTWKHHDSVRRLRTNTLSTYTHHAGLEALAVAMASNWIQEGDRQRHFIVMFTDAPAHRLEDRVGDVTSAYASQIPLSLDKMCAAWEGKGQSASGVAITLKQPARRLVLFAPDMYPWSTIGDSWGQTVFYPSKAGEGLAEIEHDTILEVLANGI